MSTQRQGNMSGGGASGATASLVIATGDTIPLDIKVNGELPSAIWITVDTALGEYDATGFTQDDIQDGLMVYFQKLNTGTVNRNKIVYTDSNGDSYNHVNFAREVLVLRYFDGTGFRVVG